jgi:site-specific DNA-methyltransferase (adenine-specific)
VGVKINEGFGVLLIDPPWPYDNNQGHDSARGGTPYECMSMEDLCGLKPLIDQVVAKDSILFLWSSYPKLPQALQFMEAIGFEYTTVAFTWIKLNGNGKIISPEQNMVAMNSLDKQEGFKLTPKDIILKGGIRSGQGYYTNSNAEICLVGKRGKAASLRVNKSVKQVVVAPMLGHSAKPEEVRSRINELTGNIPALELFARPPGRVPGWVKLGYEIDQEDIHIMLERLINGEYSIPKNNTDLSL